MCVSDNDSAIVVPTQPTELKCEHLQCHVRLEGHSSSGCSHQLDIRTCTAQFVNYLSSACPNIELVSSVSYFGKTKSSDLVQKKEE